MLHVLRIWRAYLQLGFFGADSLKPVHIYSNVSWVGELADHYCRDWCPSCSEVVSVSRDSNSMMPLLSMFVFLCV